MNFDNQPPEWQIEGVKPPVEIRKTTGWRAGYKPPAGYFNWFFNSCYKCLKELQEKLSSLAATEQKDVSDLNDSLALKANLNSPALTGIPTAPTAESGTSTEQLATTAFVGEAISNIDSSTFQKHTTLMPNANLNTLVNDGSYICAGTLINAPIANSYCIVQVYDTSSTNRIVQLCYVPQSNDTSVKAFIRAATGDNFGAWRELTTAAAIGEEINYLLVLINENTFRTRATSEALTKGISTLFIETFKSLEDINAMQGTGETTISRYYDGTRHIFDKQDDTTVTLYSVVKTVTAGNNQAWMYLDWENISGGSITVEISRNAGINFTTLNHNVVTPISSQTAGVSMIVKLTLNGKVRLNNIAWGTKA